MSKQNVKEFYDVLANDSKLQEKIMKLEQTKKVKEITDTEDAKGVISAILIPIAKEVGYEFTLEDINEYIEDFSGVGKMNAFSDWDTCFCVAGGGGYCRKKDFSCACILGGGGKHDDDYITLICVIGGGLGYH